MPINGVLDMQRRSVQIGEIRTGTSVAVPGKSYRRPVRLETFRFTTASEAAAKAVAELYGGSVAPWDQKKGRWEVVTDRTAIDVWVPPRGEAVDANMELWDGPKCLRRCDGFTMSVPARQPCMCPQAEDPGDPESVLKARDERLRLAGLKPPQACKPLTRINVTISDLPGLLGVWRLNTGSVNAAVETADSGDAMALARAGGKYLPAVLRIEWRVRSADGKPYAVPVLQIGLSMRELAEGALPAGPGGLLAQLRGTPEAGQPKAITAGTSPVQEVPDAAVVPDLARHQDGGVAVGVHDVLAAGAGSPLRAGRVGEDPADQPQAPSAGPVMSSPVGGPEPVLDPGTEPWEQAQVIYQRALAAEDRLAVQECASEAKARNLGDEHVCVDRVNDVWEPLLPLLQELWREKPQGAA